MSKAAVVLVPAALLAAAIWIIIRGIDVMVAQENSNHAIARVMGGVYQGRLDSVSHVLIFQCGGIIELHEEIKW